MADEEDWAGNGYHDERPECPYCRAPVEICHDDGYGYDEGRTYEQECGNCENTFAFTTCISFAYQTSKAPCLNGAPHRLERMRVYPNHWPDGVRCQDCGFQDQGAFVNDPPSPEEWPMKITKEELEALGLDEREPGGGVYCPKCDRGLKFNSGNPAVFHEEDCERYAEGPTYVGSGQIKLPATKGPDGKLTV